MDSNNQGDSDTDTGFDVNAESSSAVTHQTCDGESENANHTASVAASGKWFYAMASCWYKKASLMIRPP